MEIKSTAGRKSILKLKRDEKKRYQDFQDVKKQAEERDDDGLRRMAENEFLNFVSPFLVNLGLTPKGIINPRTYGNLIVQCNDFKMGQVGHLKSGFRYKTLKPSNIPARR